MVRRAAKCIVDDVVERDLSKCSCLDYVTLNSGTEGLGQKKTLLSLFDSRYQQKSAEYETECSLFFERDPLLNINLPMSNLCTWTNLIV